METIGLIVNPVAGQGSDHNRETAKQVVSHLSPQQVWTGPGDLGETAVSQAHIISIPELEGRDVTRFLARSLAAMPISALVVIGGDGTLADVALAIEGSKYRPPILGIGAGSTNVGSLITCTADDVAILQEAHLHSESVDALLAGCDGQDLAMAFNDVVIGTTILGTIAGKVIDIDALAFFRGQRIPGKPQPVGVAGARVVKYTNGRSIEVAQDEAVGTLVAGFAVHECFFGKAISGPVGLTSLTDLPAGCLVSGQPLVRTQIDVAAMLAAEPVHSSYVSLGEKDLIMVTGLDTPAMLCADGNPLKALQPSDQATIRVKRHAVDVLRIDAA